MAGKTGKKTPTETMTEQAVAAQQTPPVISWLPQQEEAPEPAPEPTPTTDPTVDTEKPEAASKGQQEPTTDTGKKEDDPAPTEKKKRKVTKGGKILVSCYINESDYEQLEKLARNRAIVAGEKNTRGQGIGASTIVCEAVAEYVQAHKQEIALWESSADFFKPENIKQFLMEQYRLSQEQLQREIEKG